MEGVILSYWETILLGIPSGIVSAFLVWLTIKTWATVFTPWLRTQIYRGVDVRGEWTLVQLTDDQGQVVSEMELAAQTVSYVLNIEKQYGHVLKGWFSQSVKSSDTETQGRYLVRGQILDGVVMLSLSPQNKSKSSFGTLLMYVVCAGAQLEGKFTFKGAKTNKINAIDISLKKRL
ncbi:hypothetical protein AB3D11_001324 [Vibrio vulnificus]|nr:hypothetical protein [Vibrio cholerae]MBY8023702.1 hypothetical protein [Vibrio fluvialis]MCU8100775.1 hypothetical protein [Vibrio vulnificus]MCU8455923.1 hypothetical protein [Vibrio vulnificus]HAS8378263.1 hypothetical protein [Vibrio vulnificus]